MNRPPISPWMAVELPQHERLEQDQTTDVCVIGAGIAGLSVAYRLAREGKSVVVVEDGTIGSGETSRTTAHLVDAFDDRYSEVARLHGDEAARHTAESHRAAIADVERIAAEEGIGCGFERLDGYLFVPPGESIDVLEAEIEACHAAGLSSVEWVDRAPFEAFETGRCLRFPRQAQFNPMQYLRGLASAIERFGGKIFTHTHASTIEGGRGGLPGRVETSQNGPLVKASHIVVATNSPVNDWITLHTKQYPYRTYVIAGRIADRSVTRALYWDTAQPYHYVRVHSDDDHDLLIVGGEDHKTGQENDADNPYGRLEDWARDRFPTLREVEYRWSGQVMEPMDALAFIGRNPGDDNVWIVTGDSGNGMTHGVIAGMLISDLIQGRDNPWAKLYDPSRKPVRAAGEFVRENVNSAAQYVDWVTPGDVKDEAQIGPGCGAVLRHGLKKVAVYRDDDGRFHRCTAVCPHLGAIVRWNDQERTWDCPAHGSRFDPHGRVLNGPANGDLSTIEEVAHAEAAAGSGDGR